MTLLAILIAAVVAQDDALKVAVENFQEPVRKKISEIVNSPTVTVTSEATPVNSGIDIYDYLLDELPFAAQCVRALGKGKYEIYRATDLVKTDSLKAQDRARLARTFYMDDKNGMFIKAERVEKSPGRWVYLTSGYYDMASVTRIWGKAVIVVICKKDEKTGTLTTQARIYARVDGAAGVAAKLLPAVAENATRNKTALFIEAARTIAELSHREPAKFLDKIAATGQVDKIVLETFRKKFVK